MNCPVHSVRKLNNCLNVSLGGTGPFHCAWKGYNKSQAKCLFLNNRNDPRQLLKGEIKLFPGEKLMESAKYEISEVPINEYSWHMNLKILNVQKHDFGSYVCASVNALGKVEGDVRLQGKLVYYTHPQDRLAHATPVCLRTWRRYIEVADKLQNWKFFFCLTRKSYLK